MSIFHRCLCIATVSVYQIGKLCFNKTQKIYVLCWLDECKSGANNYDNVRS
jgi:hypothetical protein